MIGITSFSKEGYDQYGLNFLESIDNWPGKIICYLESPIKFEHPKLEKRDFFDVPDVSAFLSNIENHPNCKGMVNGRYDYNFNLWKFCRKMFCQFDAFNEGGKMFWLDADLELIKPIPEKWLEDMFDDEHLIFLGRKDFYSEAGFVGFDTDHMAFDRFKERYIDTLKKGIIFNLKQWHDCAAFDYAREAMGKDLSPFWVKGKDDLHVFPKTILNQYMVHRKGAMKNEISRPI